MAATVSHSGSHLLSKIEIPSKQKSTTQSQSGWHSEKGNQSHQQHKQAILCKQATAHVWFGVQALPELEPDQIEPE